MYQVRSGQMTQYSAYTGGCIGISPGCPCAELNQSVVTGGFVPTLPGAVTGIIYTVGSIIVSWNTPREGTGPFRYIVTPYKNGQIQPNVETPNTSHRFTDVEEGATYTFVVCAKNDFGTGPVVAAPTSIIAPPHQITEAIAGSGNITDPTPSITYLLDSGLDNVMEYAKKSNLGPTRGSRLAYLWVASLVQAWNWVSSSFISGTMDQWNWSEGASVPLSARDQICWMSSVMDVVTPQILSGYSYHSLFPFSENDILRVKTTGQWSTWFSRWSVWLLGRQQDGSAAASAADQPTESANWSQTLIVDGVTVNPIASYPAPQEWTALAVKGKRQGYLTNKWQDVRSTCLFGADESAVVAGIQPLVGADRDAEIDGVMAITAGLTDNQKICAEFWAGGPTTVSPPLILVWLWREYVRSRSDIGCDTLLYSLLDLAIHLFESGRIVWGLKRLFFQARPIQEIRRRYAGSRVASWNGDIDGSQWMPYQVASFVTPPFADFPSGHSAFSKSFALVMTKWFGPTIQKGIVPYRQMALISPLFPADQVGAYGDFTISAGASEVQPSAVPSAPVTLSFSSWDEMASGIEGAGISRLHGGIHCLSAHQGSQQLASQLHIQLEACWAIPTSSLVVPVPSVPSVPSVPQEPVPEPQPVPVPQEPVPEPQPVPQEPVPVPVPQEPVPIPQPVPVPVPQEPVPQPYAIQINYMSQVPSPAIQALLSESTNWIQRLMLHTHGLRLPSVSPDYDMIVDVDIQPMAQGILAGARPTLWNTAVSPAMPLRQSVTLNSNALTSDSLLGPCMLNGSAVVKLLPVMIHEMLHGLGIASLPSTGDVGWDMFLDPTHTWYIGRQGDANSVAIQAYQAIIGSSADRIPVENSFGQGTAYSHWEEGMKDGFVSEIRTYNGVSYPSLPNEIMTGIAGSTFYLTKMTAGALLDYGYPIDMASDAIGVYPSQN